jgi:hypothetical protein
MGLATLGATGCSAKRIKPLSIGVVTLIGLLPEVSHTFNIISNSAYAFHIKKYKFQGTADTVAATGEMVRSYKLPALHAHSQHNIHLRAQPKACEQTHVCHEVVAKLVA